MKELLNEKKSKYPYSSIKALEILIVVSFASITFDDSKLDWPILILASAAVFAGSPPEKLGYLLVLLSWIYLGSLILDKNIGKRLVIIIAIGILAIIVILQGYGMFANGYPDIVNRNHWFIGSSVLFLISSAILLFRVLSTRKV
ncbi:hypothetical protein [Spirosoma radiotolerans]|uniref:Transmembrane protein n=1 Tax=Spirosoma radiotolerans TaxID=1379870 RepID=A0A0E3V592_9BACT|nr:hypothetical protein [Spirosoma radiotolerans]AKD53972.1 hypothetical protein SD10_02670 [Spirosoma radiotolerans]